MKQDVLHVRDVVSKTFIIRNGHATITTDFTEEALVPDYFMPKLTDMFNFAYNRADDFKQAKSGNIYLEISGGQYEEAIGNPAQAIWDAATAPTTV